MIYNVRVIATFSRFGPTERDIDETVSVDASSEKIAHGLARAAVGRAIQRLYQSKEIKSEILR